MKTLMMLGKDEKLIQDSVKILAGLPPLANLGDLNLSASDSRENSFLSHFYSTYSPLLICQSGAERKENTQRQKPCAAN